MPLLKSLVCIKGFDNGRRFLVISLSCYLLFFVLSSVLLKATLLLVLLLLSCSPILLTTSIRRMHDAGFSVILSAIPLLIFWLCVFGVTYINHSASWFLLLLAALVILAMTTISKATVNHNHHYVMGYSGPVDLNRSYEKIPAHHFHHERIEPTLTAGQTVSSSQQTNPLDSVNRSNTVSPGINSRAHGTSWENKLGQWFLNNRQLTLLSIAVIFVGIIISIAFGVLDESQPAIKETAAQTRVQHQRQRLHKIEMPDSFWVMLDEFDALTIGWQGDFKPDGEVWSAMTAQGDHDCMEMRFSIADEYRSMQVRIKNGGDYYADFSPVDTHKIIHSIAKRDKFKLCGYEFSLKGTQAKLMNNKKYSTYFDQ